VKLVPINRDTHAKLRLRPLSSFLFVGETAAVSLYGSEAMRAAHEFPVVFTAEPEGYFPAGLLGLRSGQNLFVNSQGRWLADYIPAVWRRGAFRLARLQDSDDRVLCLDETSDLVSTGEGEPIYDEAGTPTAILDQAGRFLVQLEREATATLAACAALDRLGLIVPFELKIDRGRGGAQTVSGLFRIDAARLPQLSSDRLAELLTLGALPLVYAHQFSLHKLAALGRLATEREEEDLRRQTLKLGKLNLDQVFGIVEDDPFIF
jgi:hypothetical protein